MKVVYTFPAGSEGWTIDAPGGQPAPQEGDAVEHPDGGYIVRRVVFYPWGDDDDEPFIYVVLRRP